MQACFFLSLVPRDHVKDGGRLEELADEVDYEFNELNIGQKTESADFELKWRFQSDEREPVGLHFKTTSFSTNFPYEMRLAATFQSQAGLETASPVQLNAFTNIFRSMIPNPISDQIDMPYRKATNFNEASLAFDQLERILSRLEESQWRIKDEANSWYTPSAEMNPTPGTAIFIRQPEFDHRCGANAQPRIFGFQISKHQSTEEDESFRFPIPKYLRADQKASEQY